MGHAFGLALQGRFNDPVSLALIIVRFAPATGSDLPDLPDALLVHPLAPKLHGGSAHAEPLGDGHILLTRLRFQDNPAAQRHLLRRSVFGLTEIIPIAATLSSYLWDTTLAAEHARRTKTGPSRKARPR